MPYRKDAFTEGHYYHIYNRGAGRGDIFFSSDNYTHCLRLVKKYLPSYAVSVVAYCLMPNHYHFLLRQDGERPLSRFVAVLFNAYVQAVNRQQERSGTLFEGRFKHVHVDRDEYLLHLARYIHANPVKAGLVPDPAEWPFSNYLEWLQERGGTLVDHDLVHAFFPDRADYRTFVLDYIHDEDQLPAGLSSYLFDDDHPPEGSEPSGGFTQARPDR